MRTAFLDTRADHARNVWNAYRVKALAGVSTCTLGRLFRGERLTPATAAKIEAAAQPATEAA